MLSSKSRCLGQDVSIVNPGVPIYNICDPKSVLLLKGSTPHTQPIISLKCVRIEGF